MMFIAGFITCLLLIIAIALIEARFDGHAINSLTKKASNRVLKRRAELFTPDSDEQRLQSELIERNAADGKGTSLDDL